MINVTDSASEEAKRLLIKEEKEGWGLRLGVKGGGCSGLSYTMDFCRKENDNDKIFEFNGMKLFIDPKSYLYLNGLTLDYSNELMNGGFKFLNPNASSSCACNKSFST